MILVDAHELERDLERWTKNMDQNNPLLGL